jgi:Ca2+ transporting ATPase
MTAKQDSIRTPLMESLETFTGQLYKIVTAICLSMWIVSIPKFSGSVFSSWSQGAVHYAKVAVALGE